MICKICGVEETDNPDGICDRCNERIKKGKISRCVDCGKWKKNKLPRCYDCWLKFENKSNNLTSEIEEQKQEELKGEISKSNDDEIYLGMNDDVKLVADFLSDLNLSWRHEPLVRLMDDKYQTREWHPTFFLYQFGIYLEVCSEDRIDECNYKKEIYKLNNLFVIVAETYKNDEEWKGHIINYLINIEKYRLGILLGNLYDKITLESPLNDSLFDSVKGKTQESEILEIEYGRILQEIKEKSRKSIFYNKYELDIHEKYPRAYHTWTKKEDTLLFTLCNHGKSIKALSEMFERQPEAIRSRLNKTKRKMKS